MSHHTKSGRLRQQENKRRREVVVSIGPSIFHNDNHRTEARQMFSILEPNLQDLSKTQLFYIATAMTHPELSLDTKVMLTSLAQLAGPALTEPVTEDELHEHMQSGLSGASRLLLGITKTEGNA